MQGQTRVSAPDRNLMINVRVLDETRVLFDGEGERVYFPGKEGEFEVAQNHAPVLSLLQKGTIIITGADAQVRTRTTRIPIACGIMKGEHNRVLVIVECTI